MLPAWYDRAMKNQRSGGIPLFDRYVGIDYSGAQTPTSSLKAMRIYLADRVTPPCEALPPPSPRKYWTRREIVEWLEQLLSEDRPTLVGIDHGFSLPCSISLSIPSRSVGKPSWKISSTIGPPIKTTPYVRFVRDGLHGNGAARSGNRRWRRLTEVRSRTAKSVFQFDVPGSVATSTHAGLPWLLRLLRQTAGRVHFWPFDGWHIPSGRSVVAEVYPSLWSKGFAREDRDSHRHDAYSIAAWMRQADGDGSLVDFFNPHLDGSDRKIAEIEG
jgi:hypothetical protein